MISMEYITNRTGLRKSRPVDQWGVRVGGAALTILAMFWLIAGLEMVGLTIPYLRAVFGTILLMFVPGALLVYLLSLRVKSIGRFVVFSVGLSFVAVAVVSVLGSVLLPLIEVRSPLAVLPLVLLVTALVLALLGPVAVLALTRFHPQPPGDLPVVSLGSTEESPGYTTGHYATLTLIAGLPILAGIAATVMGRTGNNALMYLFVTTVGVVVLLLPTRAIPRGLYPPVLFSIALSTLLHRNLVTDHVVGADIQATYFLTHVIAEAQYWSPDLGGVLLALPMVTAVPVVFSKVAGVDLVTVFRLVYVLLFSFVPLGIYYVGTDVVEERVGLFAGLFFTFYHGSFYFTPGKQLVSELFVVLLILLFVQGARPNGVGIGRGFVGKGEKAAALLLAIGVVFSHYGMTYVLGLSLLVAAVGLAYIRLFAREFTYGLSLWYPVLLLSGATAWYASTALDLLSLLVSIPLSIATQISRLARYEPIERSGADYTIQQTTVLDEVRIVLMMVVTALLVLGIAWAALTHLRDMYRGRPTEYVEVTSLAVPLLAFVTASYFVVFQLWADRAYQMALVVLAVFMPIGYLIVIWPPTAVLRRLVPSVQMSSGVAWTGLAVLLALLLVLNSGMAYALVGTAQTSTFNADAHDLVFNSDERDGAEWLRDRPEIERVDGTTQTTDRDDEIRIYMDSTSAQLFRAMLPEAYYNVEIIRVKSRWEPQIDPDSIDGPGYVFLRQRSVVAPDRTGEVSVSELTQTDVDELITDRTIVFENDDVRIVEVNDE